MSRTLKYDIPGEDPRRAISHVAEVGWEALFEAGSGLESVEEGAMVVEVGFGRGEFLLELAAVSPKVAFVGIEVSFKRTLKMARKVARAGLRNVRLIEGPAEGSFRELFPENSLAAIWINFSDPWPKDRHAHRRVIQPPFVATAASRLAADGALYVATDDVTYAHQIDEVLAAESKLVNRYAPQPYLPEVAGRIKTGYEVQWLAEGRPMHFFSYGRRSNVEMGIDVNGDVNGDLKGNVASDIDIDIDIEDEMREPSDRREAAR
jgi:tRNA (guanine-N7-)-methyltransferase